MRTVGFPIHHDDMDEIAPFDLQGQQAQQAQAQHAKLVEQERDAEAFSWLMADKRGRRLVWGQLVRAGVFGLSFSHDALVMAFNEGRRNEGLALLAKIHSLCPELYTVMISENKE